MNRKKKLRIIQFSLLLISLIILIFSYSNRFKLSDKDIISEEIQNKVDEQLSKEADGGDTFYNISFSGLDLSGNRYILNAEEAKNDKIKPEIIYMKEIDAIFYFKDGTDLKILADKGVYNNKSLNMIFEKNIKAFYENSSLLAEKAEFSNSKGLLIVSDEIRFKDQKGILVADKLLFDVKKQTLNISAFENKKVNANIDLK
tara:strand:- start:3563 stop:4165 length:603 start_codon:yes stop_codon:yes gene_type:complete